MSLSDKLNNLNISEMSDEDLVTLNELIIKKLYFKKKNVVDIDNINNKLKIYNENLNIKKELDSSNDGLNNSLNNSSNKENIINELDKEIDELDNSISIKRNIIKSNFYNGKSFLNEELESELEQMDIKLTKLIDKKDNVQNITRVLYNSYIDLIKTINENDDLYYNIPKEITYNISEKLYVVTSKNNELWKLEHCNEVYKSLSDKKTNIDFPHNLVVNLIKRLEIIYEIHQHETDCSDNSILLSLVDNLSVTNSEYVVKFIINFIDKHADGFEDNYQKIKDICKLLYNTSNIDLNSLND